MPPRGLHNLLQPELLGPSGSDWGELQLADDDAAAAAADGEYMVVQLLELYVNHMLLLSACASKGVLLSWNCRALPWNGRDHLLLLPPWPVVTLNQARA